MQHSNTVWFLLSYLTLRAICPAINTGLSNTRKAGIRSSQFSFVPVNKPIFFNFSLWMQPPITSTIVNWTFLGTIISIWYYTDQSIPGDVKFFMINVSSFQHAYYNCINILFPSYSSAQIHKVCSVISFFTSIQMLKYTEMNCWTTDSFFPTCYSLASQAFYYISHFGSCFEELDCTSASWFLPILNAIFSTAHPSRCSIKKVNILFLPLFPWSSANPVKQTSAISHSIPFTLHLPPYLKKHYLYFPPQK